MIYLISPNKRISMALLHIGLWGFLFIFPTIFNDHFHWQQAFYRNWMPLFMAGLVFYINYYIIIPRFYFTKNYYVFGLINIILILVFLVLMYYIRDFVREDLIKELNKVESNESKQMRSFGDSSALERFWFRNGITLMLSAGVAVAVRVSGKWQEEESKRKLAENEHLKSELTSLKFQMQPHFFFNTLNNIYALIDRDPAQAKDTVHKLSKLMRYVLYKSNVPEISLKEETDFIKAYTDVMRVRFGSHVKMVINLPEITNSIAVPPLLFIPLVENAFKHGIDAYKNSYIDIRLSLSENSLEFNVSNSLFPKTVEDESGSGIGIENLKQRLNFLYPEKNCSFVQKTTDSEYSATLNLPIKHSHA